MCGNYNIWTLVLSLAVSFIGSITVLAEDGDLAEVFSGETVNDILAGGHNPIHTGDRLKTTLHNRHLAAKRPVQRQVGLQLQKRKDLHREHQRINCF